MKDLCVKMCVTVIPENPKSGNENKQYKQE